MTASSGLKPLRCNSSIPNAPTAVSRPAGKSGIPKSRLRASAAPMNSARSVAIAMTSACTQSKNVTGRGKRARHTSGRFLPVAIPSLADIDWMSMAMRLETRITHNSRYPNCAPPEMFVAKFPGSTYATAAINAGPRKGRSLRIPLLLTLQRLVRSPRRRTLPRQHSLDTSYHLISPSTHENLYRLEFSFG